MSSHAFGTQRALEDRISSSQAHPMKVVGQFLEDLFSHPLVKNSLSLPHQNYSVSHHLAQPLYFCPNYSQMNFLCLILKIFSKVPEAYQVLRCQETTTEDELKLFLKRVEIHCSHYLILNVNNLPYKLQEVIRLMCLLQASQMIYRRR